MNDIRKPEIKTKWKVSPEVLSARIDDEVVLMSIEAGYYFSLDPTGSRIWELLSGRPSTIAELADMLMEEYEVEKDTCIADVMNFIGTMAARKLVTEAGEDC